MIDKAKPVAVKAKSLSKTKGAFALYGMVGFGGLQATLEKVQPGCGAALGQALEVLIGLVPIL